MKPVKVDAPNNLGFKVTERIFKDMTTPVGEKRFPLPRVIPIMIQKGGTGKTTITANLAGALAARGKKVLMIDLDHQGNLTMNFGAMNPEIYDQEKTIYEVLLLKKEISEVMLEVGKNLFLVPACFTLNALETDLSSQRGADIRLLTQIDPIKEYFDYILMDAPPAMNKIVFNAMIAATDILVPWNPDYFATQALNDFFQNLTMTAEFHDQAMGRFNGIIVNKFNKNIERTKLCQEMTATIQERFPDQIFKATIPATTKIGEATSRLGTILEHDPSSTGADAINSLADEIIAQEASND